MKTFERPEDEIALGKEFWYRLHTNKYSKEEMAKQDAKLVEYLQRYIVEPIDPNEPNKVLTIKKDYDNCNALTGHPIYSVNNYMYLNGQSGKDNSYYLWFLAAMISFIISYFMYSPLVVFAVDYASQWHQSIYTNDISNWLARLVNLEDISPFMARNRPYFIGLMSIFHTIAMTPMAMINLPLIFLSMTNTNARDYFYNNFHQYINLESDDRGNRDKIVLYCRITDNLILVYRNAIIADWYLRDVLHLEQIPITEVDKHNVLRNNPDAEHHSIHLKDIQFLNPKGGYFRNDHY